MFLTDLIYWIIFWLLGWGIFFLLWKKYLHYILHPFLVALHFLLFTILSIILFKKELIPLVDGFTIVPFALLFLVIMITIGVYFLSHSYLTRPTKLIEKYPREFFLAMDYRYMFSKSFEILFQQVMVVILVLLLWEEGLNIVSICALFATVFGIVHIPLIRTEGWFFGCFFTVSSALSGILFPPLILKVHYGFVYTYTIHWVYYTVSGVFFWIYKPR